MTSPIALSVFYDELMRHDWHHDRSDDHGVWRRGQAELSRLTTVSKTSPEHQALFKSIQGYHFGPSETPKPARPAENATFTPPPPAPPAGELADLSDEDRASVLVSPQPSVRLREIQQRLDLDQRLPFAAVLNAFGATQDDKNPSRWTFPDGAIAMVKLDRKAWVEQTTLTTGQGPTALLRRLTGQSEIEALATLSALDGAAFPVKPAPWSAVASIPSVPMELGTPEAPRRFIRRNR